MASPEGKAAAESLIPRFKFQRLLNLDQQARRITLVGEIDSKPALLTLERAAFPTDPAVITALLTSISRTTNLGSNDIYRWYMAQSGSSVSTDESTPSKSTPPADLKLNLIYPCTEQHIKKYTPQRVRMVTETPTIYARHVRPYMEQKRAQGRLNWVFNILEGRTEQEDVIMRDAGPAGADEGFLLLPDLNWDRSTVEGLRLLALVERRDLWSLRDLKRRHVSWLKDMRERVLDATVKVYGDKGVERDLLKCYFHCKLLGFHCFNQQSSLWQVCQ